MKHIVAFASAVAFVACSGASAAPIAATPDFSDFGFRLFSQVAANAPAKNVVFSPLSAGLALSMAYDGAVGQTASEMAQTLGVTGLNPDELDSSNASLLSSVRDQHGVDIEIANSVWLDSGHIAPSGEYVHRIEAAYRAQVRSASFLDPATPSAMNAWVNEQTRGKIGGIIDSIDAEASMYLFNALYFKGDWAYKFDPALTKSKSFELPGNETATVARMHQTREFQYFETADFQTVRLPYAGDRFAMEVFLPARNSNLARFESQLKAANWDVWQQAYGDRDGTLELPKFSIDWNAKLRKTLQVMGMIRAFNKGDAQFYRMYPRSPLYVVYLEDVLQKTYLKVDEKGSEAAAATVVEVGIHPTVTIARPAPFEMIVDRPFFCAVVDNASASPLFLAAVSDPR